MSRFLLVVLAGCSNAVVPIPDPGSETVPDPDGPGTGFETGPWEDPTEPAPEVDDPLYDGAYARIVSPRAGDVIPSGEPFSYEVGVYAADGTALEGSGVEWYASDDPDFTSDQMVFETDSLAVGTHEITAIVDLPNGDRLAHGVGGVKVQSAYSGTYGGLFSVDGSVTQITISCSGSAVIVVGPFGDLGEGSGDCLVSLLGLDVPMTWLFTLENDAGTLTGSAGVDLLGFFTYDIPMTGGTVDPEGTGLALDFAGPIPFIGNLSAFLEAPRISLESE